MSLMQSHSVSKFIRYFQTGTNLFIAEIAYFNGFLTLAMQNKNMHLKHQTKSFPIVIDY